MAAPLPLSVLLILTILVAINVPKAAECLSSNATRDVDFLLDDEEFSMQSEANRRILQVGRGRTRTPYAHLKVLPFCDAAAYGSCIGKDSKIYKRPCDYLNTCKRIA